MPLIMMKREASPLNRDQYRPCDLCLLFVRPFPDVHFGEHKSRSKARSSSGGQADGRIVSGRSRPPILAQTADPPHTRKPP